MRLKKLCKVIDFDETVRSRLIFGVDVRLDSINGYLKLKESNGTYSDDDDLYVKTWAINPNNVKQWLGFECVVNNAKGDDGAFVTGVNFRLHNETNEYWWNGTAWVVDVEHWNTETDIANHISTFPVSNKKIGVVINLYTTDVKKTPIVKAIKFLYNSDIEFFDDYLYRTIVRQLGENLRPITDYPITVSTTGTTINLNTYPLETPYEIVGVDSVFNHTTDEGHAVDIFSSYNPSTKVITLGASISSGQKAWVKLIYKPEIVVTTSSEYHEQSKVPAIVLDDIRLVNPVKLSFEEFVLNKSTYVGWKIYPPKRYDMDISMNIVTDSARDQVRLADEVKRFFDTHTMLTSWGLDEKFDLVVTQEYSTQNSVAFEGAHGGKLRFSLVGTLYYEKDAVAAYAVRHFKITGDMRVTV